jgi:hypothetical protein
MLMNLFCRPWWVFAALAAVSVLSPASLSVAWAGPGFVPHRAVYGLSLGKSRSSSSVSQARGKLEFEWADVCTGWTVSQRTRVSMTTGEGQVIDFGWTLNALEAKDGKHYRFFIRRLDNGEVTEELRGEARLTAVGGRGVATYSKPAAREVPLPKGTIFPTRHSLILMEAAEGGDMPLWRLVFDGSGDDGLFGVNAALAQALPAGAPVQRDLPVLRGQPSWRMNLAFFSMDETVSEPEHEQALRLFANGVVDEMLLDYGDFALKADLLSAEALPEIQCKPE